MLRCLLLVLALASLRSAEPDADEPPLLAAIREAAADHDSLRTTFSMERHLAVFEEPVTSTGSLEIDRDLGGVRWEFTDELLLILRDDELRRWDGAGNEEAVDPARDPGAAVLARQMRALLGGDWSEVHRDFAAEWDPDNPQELILVPGDAAMRKLVERVVVTFGAENGFPTELVIHASGDNRTIYRFAEPELDVELDRTRFAGPAP